MKTKLNSIIIIMILVMSSMSVYANGNSTYDVVQTENSIFVYNRNTNEAKIYSADNNDYRTPSTQTYSEDEWNDLVGSHVFTGSVLTDATTAEVNQRLTEVGATPLAEPEKPAGEQPPANRQDQTPGRTPITTDGNPERLKYLDGIVQERQAAVNSLQTKVNAATNDAERARLQAELANEQARLNYFQKVQEEMAKPGRTDQAYRHGMAVTLAERYNQLGRDINGLENQIDTLEEGEETPEEEARLEELRKQLREKEKEQDSISQAQVSYGANELLLQDLQQDLTAVSNRLGEARTRLGTTNTNVQTAQTDLQNAETELQNLRTQLDQAREQGNTDKVTELEAQIETQQTEVSRRRGLLTTAQAAQADAQATSESVAALHRDVAAQLREAEIRKEYLDLASNIDSLQQTLQQKQQELAKTEDSDRRADLQREIRTTQRELERKKNEALWKKPWFYQYGTVETVFNTIARGIILIFDFVQAYEEYSGIGSWTSLDYGMSQRLIERRRETAQLFCEEIVGLAGTQCWQSRICEQHFTEHELPAGTGILVTEIGPGGRAAAASIQAEKSFPATYSRAGQAVTERTYKITYFIENPHFEKVLNYYVELRGSKTFKTQERSLEGRNLEGGQETAGGKEGRLQTDPLIFESANNYDEACLVFSPEIFRAGGGYASELCVPIQQYQGAATRPYDLNPAANDAANNASGTPPATGVNMNGA